MNIGSFILYFIGGDIVFAGCYYGETNGGGPAMSIIGWLIIAATAGIKHLIHASFDKADIQLEVNRRK